MSCRDEAEALRDKIDDLAQRAASVESWKLLDAQLFHALVEGQFEINALQSEMIALVKTSKPNWCWFQTHQSLRELREAIDASPAPVVAVSPIVDGQVLKGPTEAFLRWAGQTMDAPGIAATYAGVIDAIVTDEEVDLPVPALRTSTLMSDAASRERVARETLDFALALAG